jgi:catechol 2,3-dioxygenase-like lactoylglutathione lyase family enzyme
MKSKPRITEAVPVFLVGDVARAMRWYRDQLGFAVRAVPPSPPHTFGIMTRDDVTIFLQQLEGYVRPDRYAEREGGVWNVYLQTNDVGALFEAVSEIPDVEILETLEHRDYGQTEFVIRDPDGYVLVFAQPD